MIDEYNECRRKIYREYKENEEDKRTECFAIFKLLLEVNIIVQ